MELHATYEAEFMNQPPVQYYAYVPASFDRQKLSLIEGQFGFRFNEVRSEFLGAELVPTSYRKFYFYVRATFDRSKFTFLEGLLGIRFCESGLESVLEAELLAEEISRLDITNLPEDAAPILTLLKTPQVLANIANKLDPRSLLTFARSSPLLYHFFCQPSVRNIVSVPLKKERLIALQLGTPAFDGFVQMVQKWPFYVQVDVVDFEEIGVQQAREVLDRIGARAVREMDFKEHIGFNDLIELIDRYRVKEVELLWSHEPYAEEEYITLLHKPLVSLNDHTIPTRLVHICNIPTLTAYRGGMTTDILRQVTAKFLSNDSLVDWKLSPRLGPASFINSFALPFYPFEYMGPLPEQRPIAFINGDQMDHRVGLTLYILRADGKLVKIQETYELDDDLYLRMSICPVIQGPPVLFLQ